jgi:DNA polymerase III epsilon subunit family exonuclease
VTRAGLLAPLEDRVANILEASGGEGSLPDLAVQIFKTGSGPCAASVLGALLYRDPRFRVAGAKVILATSLPSGDAPSELSPRTPLGELPLAVVDFETSGWETSDRAIEVGVACFAGEEEVGSFETLLDPGVPPSPFVTQLTGIRGSDLKGKPSFTEVWPELAGLFRGQIVAAHNLPFDMGVLRRELRRSVGRDAFDHAGQLCTLKLARKLVPRGESRGLDALAERFSLRFSARHRALDDARVAGRLFFRLVALAAQERELVTWADLQEFLAPRRKGSGVAGRPGAIGRVS